MMKKACVSMTLSIFLLAIVIILSGCRCWPFVGGDCRQPGESDAEVNRRHIRNKRIRQQQLLEDVDTFMLTDQPSKLTDKRIP